MRAANLAIKRTTAIEIVVKTIVKPVAMLKAAPGFFNKVNWRNEPITGREDEVRFSNAQFLVRKSIAQTRQASEKRR
jgi:hypothetical protein